MLVSRNGLVLAQRGGRSLDPVDIVLREEAIADLEEIGDYIALDNPVRARSFVARIKARCLAIGRNPMAARLRPQWGVG